MKLRMNTVVMTIAIVLGSIFMFSSEAEAKTHFRYDVPDTITRDTYIEGIGYFIGFNYFGQGIFSDEPASSYVIDLGREINDDDDPYSTVEKACQHYVYEIREDVKAGQEYGYKPSLKYVQESIKQDHPADIIADLFGKTKTERSKAMQIYVNLAYQGYSIKEIYILMGSCNFSEEVMSQLFYSVYNQAQ
ncbi:hypothetical protein [Butyrivibrio sp. NC3005]|uniref:hypothetical protein n=1 Tax=Butyrivibrio sp. NC3005 TaxID=1280685 RepID=UPI000417C92A|nr:hypothetical protein [Butyrivibrio sp. NC3005]